MPSARAIAPLFMAENIGRFAGRSNVSLETGLMNLSIPRTWRMNRAHSYREQ
jgi:hypothetical protein